MRKKLLIICLLYQFHAICQIGIGTENPQQDLHIAGTDATIRIDGLNQTNHINNDGNDTKIFIDTNGKLTLNTTKTPVLLNLAGSTFINIPITINQTGYSTTMIQSSLASGSFNLTRTKTIKCNFSVGISAISETGGSSNLTDGISRIISCYLFIDGIQVSRASYSYSNSHTAGSNGIITLSANCFKTLTTGNHTWEIRGGLFGYGHTFRANFGGNTSNAMDYLQIIEFD